MSHSSPERVVWKCPECLHTFRIPKSKSRPVLCAKCVKKAAALGAVPSPSSTDDDEMYFKEAKPAKSSPLKFEVSVQRPVDTGASPEASNNVSVEHLSDRLDEALEHLEGITRTMRLVRWVMWGIGFATLLSILVTVGGLLYSMSLIGSLSNLTGPPGGVLPAGDIPGGNMPRGDARIPPQLQQDMQKIEEYSRTVDELLKEVNQ
jgi:hypothetical protein